MSDSAHHGDVRFEPRDVRAAPILWFLILLFTFLVIVLFALWWAQNYLVAYEESAKRPNNALATLGQGQLPPEPRIEGIGPATGANAVIRMDPATALATFRAKEMTALKDGWKDSGGGQHPPIKDAIRRVVAQFGGSK